MSSDTYTPEMVHEAVERGAAWLDEHCPDWTSHIDLDRLRLDIQSACVLGQTAECLTHYPVRTNRYTMVLTHFGKDINWAETHGFEAPIRACDPGVCNGIDCAAETKTRYEMLTVAWREYIWQRTEIPS